jgi:hypothetical protein
LNVTNNARWADVQALEWSEDGAEEAKENHTSATNAILIEDFCRYRYVLHTEGITYSGRLQFLQMCNSVLITPPPAWLQHTTHLMKPVFSHALHVALAPGGKSWEPSIGVKKAWPVSHAADRANVVFVAPDWSDLRDTLSWLEDHPSVAEGIATRQRDIFVGKGYLSPAAEVCYWRALIRGWSKVVRNIDDLPELNEGLRWEQFALGYTE